jgi:hypothetical protein
LRWEPTGAAAWYAADFAGSIFSDVAGTTVAEDEDGVERGADLLGNPDADGRMASAAITKDSIGGRPSVPWRTARPTWASAS